MEQQSDFIAHDFKVVNKSGKAIYNNITSNSAPYTVTALFRNDNSSGNDCSDVIIIPETATKKNSITYSVISIRFEVFYDCSNLASI
jgi:hypothetical protein